MVALLHLQLLVALRQPALLYVFLSIYVSIYIYVSIDLSLSLSLSLLIIHLLMVALLLLEFLVALCQPALLLLTLKRNRGDE